MKTLFIFMLALIVSAASFAQTTPQAKPQDKELAKPVKITVTPQTLQIILSGLQLQYNEVTRQAQEAIAQLTTAAKEVTDQLPKPKAPEPDAPKLVAPADTTKNKVVPTER